LVMDDFGLSIANPFFLTMLIGQVVKQRCAKPPS
jgi:hypothetical protein